MILGRKLVFNTVLLTGSALLMRCVGMVWQVWLAGRIGAAGIGLFQLIMSVAFLASTVAISGIRFSVTRLLSEELGQDQEESVGGVMTRAVAYALFFGLTAMLVLLIGAGYIGLRWVGDARTVRSLRLFAWSLPAVGLSSVTAGYFTAVGRVWKTAAEQFAEQLLRMGLVLLFLRGIPAGDIEALCAAIVGAGALADNLGALCMLLLYFFDRARYRHGRRENRRLTPRMLRIAFPLALSAYARSALTTFRQLLVPKGLRLSGLSADAALSGYGVINGMALPVLVFPTCLPAALAELLVPALTEAQVAGETEKLRETVNALLKKTLLFSLAAGALFFVSADLLGGLIYHDASCSRYIRLLAPMVPFLYTDIVTDGCLKGLGQMMRSMAYNIAEAALGLLLTAALLPSYALAGYVFVLYFCEIFNFVLSYRRLRQIVR